MLSVCIPVYNYYVNELVLSLKSQGEKLDVDFEILLADDASDDKYRLENKKLSKLKFVKYFQLEKNIGRAKNRNYLAGKANYNNLVFLDCDMLVCDDNFLEKYQKFGNRNIVVCGGICYGIMPEDEKMFFRWYYGINREQKSVGQRSKNPHNSFMTGNFMIDKELFSKFRFNESLVKYGHEDTFFGYKLKINNVNVTHIDNPLLHVGLEKFDVFFKKTKEGIENLWNLYKNTDYDTAFADMVGLLKIYRRARKIGINYILIFKYNLFKGLMVRNLCGKNPKLWIFDFYKLEYLCKVANKS